MLCQVFPILLLVTQFLWQTTYAISGASSVDCSFSWPAPTAKDTDTEATRPIDTSFFSRQLIVYGKTAQLRLLESKALIVNECAALARETVKNLALTGVGEIYIVDHATGDREDDHCYSIQGDSPSLQQYAESLNPHVKVRKPCVYRRLVDGGRARLTVTLAC